MDQTPLRRQIGDPSTTGSTERPDDAGQWQALPHVEQRSPLQVRGVVRELLETAIFILLVFFIVRGIVQNFKIEGSSMEPTLHTGQYILVNKLVYFHFDLNAPLRLFPGQEDLPPRIIYPFYQPRRGDIVVFEYPNDVSKDYIKRVIGVPGDTIRVTDGQVYVNDTPLAEPYLDESTYCLSGYPCSDGDTGITVQPGQIFVMGDNRGNSSDSREWGPLPLDRVIGQAWLIYFPVADWGLVPHHTYDSPVFAGGP